MLALFGPTGVGKTAVALELADLLRARGEDPVAIGADALQVYEGLGVLTGAAEPSERARLEHRLVGFVPVTETFDRSATTCRSRTPRSTPRWRPGGGRSWSAAPGSTCAAALADLSLVKAQPGEESELWSTDTRHPTLLVGLTMDREAPLRAHRRGAWRRSWPPGRRGRGAARRAAGASRTARKALGFDELLDGDVEALKQRSRNYARRQLTWMRKMAAAARPGGHERHRARAGRRGGGYRGLLRSRRPRPEPGVECRAVRFEKWQALGNDYAIVEAGRASVRAHPRAGPGALRAAHGRRVRRGPAALAHARSAGSWRRCGSSTPTARRPSCPATGSARP